MGGFVAIVVLGILVFAAVSLDGAMGNAGEMLFGVVMIGGGILFLAGLIGSAFDKKR